MGALALFVTCLWGKKFCAVGLKYVTPPLISVKPSAPIIMGSGAVIMGMPWTGPVVMVPASWVGMAVRGRPLVTAEPMLSEDTTGAPAKPAPP